MTRLEHQIFQILLGQEFIASNFLEEFAVSGNVPLAISRIFYFRYQSVHLIKHVSSQSLEILAQ